MALKVSETHPSAKTVHPVNLILRFHLPLDHTRSIGRRTLATKARRKRSFNDGRHRTRKTTGGARVEDRPDPALMKGEVGEEPLDGS